MGAAVSNALACGRPNLSAVDGWDERNIQVTLHIYDLGKNNEAQQLLNSALRSVGTGAFHCGVEICGIEYSYRGKLSPGTGLFYNNPRSCRDHTYRESVLMGVSSLSRWQVMQLLSKLEDEWTGTEYSTLSRNCCHFCDRLCVCLGVGRIPEWVTNLANTGRSIYETGQTLQVSRKALLRDLQDCASWTPGLCMSGADYCGRQEMLLVESCDVHGTPRRREPGSPPPSAEPYQVALESQVALVADERRSYRGSARRC